MDETTILQFFLDRIAGDLGLHAVPGFLTRGQIALVAGFGNPHSLASAASRGVAKRQPRWLAFQQTVGRGAHRVAAERVARWRAIEAGMLPLPAPPAPGGGLAAAWGRRGA